MSDHGAVEVLDLEPFRKLVADCKRIGTSTGGVPWSKVGDDFAALIGEVDRLREALQTPTLEAPATAVTRVIASPAAEGLYASVPNAGDSGHSTPPIGESPSLPAPTTINSAAGSVWDLTNPAAVRERPQPEALEALAAYAHEAWSGWMKHLFSKARVEHPHGNADVVIPYEWAERWYRQMNTPYNDLSDDEKESDRDEARKMLKIATNGRANGDVARAHTAALLLQLTALRNWCAEKATQMRDKGLDKAGTKHAWECAGASEAFEICEQKLDTVLSGSAETKTCDTE